MTVLWHLNCTNRYFTEDGSEVSCHLFLEYLIVKRMLVSMVALVALLVVASSPLVAAEITVSPNVINIASASTVVTVHTDIPYNLVIGATVTLNGLEIEWWKADDRGYFVAKFVAAEVKELEEVAEAGEAGTLVTLELEGTLIDGTAFTGTDEVKVIDVKQKK